jgi:translation initiation factor 2B subunit (eIF-2B alpha/beta/delta family)
MIQSLKRDNTSGANELMDNALKIIKNQLEMILDTNEDIKAIILELSQKIIASRPSMAPLINLIGYLIHDLENFTKKILSTRINSYLKEKTKREVALEHAFLSFLNNFNKSDLKIMLISYSSTIINLLIKFKDFNYEFYVMESRPLLEGHNVAEILSNQFKTNLIIDAAMGKYIDQTNLILVGIDSILKDGSIINKIGTYSLAQLAKIKGLDVYAVGDSFKYNLRSHYGEEILIERKPTKEIYDKKIKNKLLEIQNFYFEITPPEYFDGIISDLGVLKIQNFLKSVKKNLPLEWYKSFLKINK